jgi:hypothetical protein
VFVPLELFMAIALPAVELAVNAPAVVATPPKVVNASVQFAEEFIFVISAGVKAA